MIKTIKLKFGGGLNLPPEEIVTTPVTVFVEPLESWLSHLNVSGHGPNWLIKIFEKMGENPESQDYLKPSDDDVWSFLGEIKEWFTNPGRKGIPS